MSSIKETVSNIEKLAKHALGVALSPVHAGDEKIASHQPGTAAPQTIQITSSAFTNGSAIPTVYTPQGIDTSPPLSWSGAPQQAKSLALIVEDPDAPFPQPYLHWVLFNLPPQTRELPIGVPTTATLSQMGNARQLANDTKSCGWFGPKPPSGHGVHHYHFQLFALDTMLSAGADSTHDQLKKEMAGHVIGEGELIGTYENK